MATGGGGAAAGGAAAAGGDASNPANLSDWVSYIDENTGQEYWYNVKTGESSWA